jgi:hypothetical protein
MFAATARALLGLAAYRKATSVGHSSARGSSLRTLQPCCPRHVALIPDQREASGTPIAARPWRPACWSPSTPPCSASAPGP